MGIIVSCFETCSHSMTLLERISFYKGKRDTYMDTIAVVIHGYESVEPSEMIPGASRPNEKTVRFRRLSESNREYMYEGKGDAEHIEGV